MCEKFGSTLAVSDWTRRRVSAISRANTSKLVRFLKAEIGWADDCASHLSKSYAGEAFLALAAPLCSVDPSNLAASAEVLCRMIRDTAVDRTEIPTVVHLKNVLAALRPKMLRAGFADDSEVWSLMWNDCERIAPPQYGRLWESRATEYCRPVPMTAVEHLVKAYREVGRLGGDAASVIIKTSNSVPWIAALTHWFLGKPPHISLDDGTVLYPEVGSRVKVIVPPDPDAEQIEIRLFTAIDGPAELLSPRKGGASRSELVKWETYWKRGHKFREPIAKLRELALREQPGFYQAILDTLPFALKQARHLLRASSEPQDATNRPCNTPNPDPSLIFPSLPVIYSALRRGLGQFYTDMSAPQKLAAETPIQSKICSLPHLSHLKSHKCNCPFCGVFEGTAYPFDDETGGPIEFVEACDLFNIKSSISQPRTCQRWLFYSHLAAATADILSYSLLQNLEDGDGDKDGLHVSPGACVPLRNLEKPCAAFANSLLHIFLHGQEAPLQTPSVIHWLFALLGCVEASYDEDLFHSWVMLSSHGQVIYPRVLEAGSITPHYGLLSMNACAGVLVRDREKFRHARCTIQTQFPNINCSDTIWQTPVLHPTSPAPADTPYWHCEVATGDGELLVQFKTKNQGLLGMTLIESENFFRARFVFDCEHGKNAPLVRYRDECIYTHPLKSGAGDKNYGPGEWFVYKLPDSSSSSSDSRGSGSVSGGSGSGSGSGSGNGSGSGSGSGSSGSSQQDLESKIGVVGFVTGEARFLALAIGGSAVVRVNSCLDCCVAICKLEGRKVVIC